jgi:hypothetical protein
VSQRRLLLVCGSRSLGAEHGGTKASTDWAYDILRSQIANPKHRPDVVINGDAHGPDRWSSMTALTLGIECRAYRLDGNVYTWDTMGSQFVHSRWRDADGPAVNPLERNRALVAAAARALDEGWDVQVLGLVAPWAKTHGTDHTLAQARHSGLKVARWDCPESYGRRVDAI